MLDFDIYNNSEEILKRKEESIYLKFIIIFIIVTLMVLVMLFKNYKDIHSFSGIVTNKEIVIYINENALQYFNNDLIILNDKEIIYKISDIKETSYSSNLQKYYQINIQIEEELTDNSVVNFNVDNGKTNLYKSFIKKIWKGFG